LTGITGHDGKQAMQIASLGYRVPAKAFTNDDVLAYMDRLNPNVARGRKNHYLAIVSKLLERSGARARHWCDKEQGERPVDLILGVMDDALEDAGMKASDIDLLIYCGVGKGFIEPANAYFYANAKGMHTANCFDVTDACMSWVRSLQTAYLMLQSGAAKNAMIVNGEFHLGFHDNWEIRGYKSLLHTFPMYTIGEATTATVLTPSDQEWIFDYRSRPEFADLCTIPLPGYEDYVEPTKRIGHNGPHGFVSWGTDLFREAQALMDELIADCIDDPTSKAWYFPHAPSKTAYETGLRKCGVPLEKVYLEVYPRFGNIVSASVPVGLSLAERTGALKRGDDIALIPASAGITTSVVQFTY
jgi:3-oxoacyl-[acyl-carrier-protein] synthase III